MSDPESTVPYGLCLCGCGHPTKIAPRTDARFGWRKGEPLRYIPGHQNRKSSREYAEEDRGHDTPCWIWQLAKETQGYGYFRRDGRHAKAHRHYYETRIGPIDDGMDLDHLCRQRDCVNPEHLEPVTNAENQRRGINAILTQSDVRLIRQRYAEGGVTQVELGRAYGVTKHAIWRIVSGRGWRST